MKDKMIGRELRAYDRTEYVDWEIKMAVNCLL